MFKELQKLYLLYEEELQNCIITDEVSKLDTEIVSVSDVLNDSLSKEQIQQLETISEIRNTRDSYVHSKLFIFAFKIAVKIIIESLIDAENEM